MSQVFMKVLEISLSASFLVLAVVAARFLLKKAPKWVRLVLWALVAVRLVLPIAPQSKASLVPDTAGLTTSLETRLDAPILVAPTQEMPGLVSPTPNAPTVDPAAPSIVDTAPAKAQGLSLLTVLAWVWASGMAVMALATAVSYLRLRKKVATAVRLQGNVYQSEHVASPFILGLFRPRIYLPFSQKAQSLSHVLAHEYAHLKRKDHLWKPLGFALLTVHWFNPLMWLGYVLLCRDIELACDEKVVKGLDAQSRADYSQALLNSSVSRRSIAACPLAFGEVGVRQRIKSVLSYKKPAFWLILVALIACIAVAVCFMTDPQKSPEKTNTTPEIPDHSSPYEDLQKVEPVGQVSEVFQEIVENNLFYNVTAFGDRLLVGETTAYDEYGRSYGHRVQMLDIYGKELASYSCNTEPGYYISTLTATQDGGFLFVLGFSDFYISEEKGWASENGFASHVIKCDASGAVQFDSAFVSLEGSGLEFCIEKNGMFYFFGTRQTPESNKPGVYNYTDVFTLVLDSRGDALKTGWIMGADFDSLHFAEADGDEFLLSISAQSGDGDFAGSTSGGYPADWVFTVNDDLEITSRKMASGRRFSDDVIGIKDGTAVYLSDPIFDTFDAGTPTAFIDYGDYYLIVSRNVTGEYENTPLYISSIWCYWETVYSAYDNSGKLIFRSSVDSSPDYDAMVESLG